MKVILETEEGPVVVYGVKEVSVQTQKGLVADPITEEGWGTGFVFKEADDVDL